MKRQVKSLQMLSLVLAGFAPLMPGFARDSGHACPSPCPGRWLRHEVRVVPGKGAGGERGGWGWPAGAASWP